MARSRAKTSVATFQVVGAVADGVVKVLLGAAFVAAASRIGDLIGVPVWLMIASGAVLLAVGGIEVRYVRRRSMSTCTRLMTVYDGGWALATLASVLMARSGSGAGGEVWIAYQTAASPAFAALLLAAAPVRPAPEPRAEEPAPGDSAPGNADAPAGCGPAEAP